MSLGPASNLLLNDGRCMPMLGFGVYQTRPGFETANAVDLALRAGYRHIDTASVYGNEADVGRAVRESGLAREAIFVTTKLWNADQGAQPAYSACLRSLEALGLDYVDLYLIHWPQPGSRLESWETLVHLREEGRVRSIGVSNFEERHLRELIEASGVVPAVNQFEMSPFLNQRRLCAACAEWGIAVAAYSPLTKGRKLGHPLVQSLSGEVGCTPAQLLLRWALQKGVAVLPKSTHPDRIRENADLFEFDLTPAQMERLDALDEGFRTSWDPTLAP